MDVMVATTNYLPNSVPLMYECMAGIPIYKTVYSEKFEQLWKMTFDSKNLRYSLNGMLLGYKNKNLAIYEDDEDLTTCELAGEAMYLGLKLLYI